MFEHIDAYPGDPILSLNENFQKDPRQNKVNLSIGIYFDDEGRLPVMKAVHTAEAAILEEPGPKPYLPMAGFAQYRDAVQALVFGADCPSRAAGRIATVQTLGGSGALKVGADFIKRYFATSQVWVSDPTWENHRFIFERAGFTVNTYPYYDEVTGGLKFEAMLSSIDAFAVRELARRGVPALVANSFSKNFSLYGERCGGLHVICEDAAAADRVLGQLTGSVRANYSNPPTHGAKIVTRVLGTPELKASWEQELAAMCERIARMRVAIHDGLRSHASEAALARYVKQRGMFTYTGLNEKQVERLKEEFGVYILRSGRMCVAGLNEKNVSVVVDAVGKVMKD